MLGKIKNNALCFSLAILTLISSIVFVTVLAITKFLSPLLLVLLFMVILVFIGFIIKLLYRKSKRTIYRNKKIILKKILAIAIAVVLIAVEFVGCYSIIIAHSTIQNIVTPNPEYHEICVYVRINDPADKLEDIVDYKFGILADIERESTDKAIEEINTILSSNISVNEYLNIEKLMDSLIKTKQVDAIILSRGMLEILEDLYDHTDDYGKIKEINIINIENVNPNDSSNNSSSTNPEVNTDDVFTAYISGIDSRGSINIRSRTDANIIATVNMKTGQILLVTTPRDYYVPLSISNGIPDKLTHSGIYGINVSRDTHEMLYDIEIDYYFKANFDGLKGIVDALGGINVYSEYPITVDKYHFEKGYNYLDGKSALVFARTRKQVTGGARQRAKNHMAVITGVINKAISPAIITNYKSVLDSASGMFETDMPYDTIIKLIQTQITKEIKWNITSYAVDGTGAYKKPYSLGFEAYVMIPDQSTVNKAKELMAVVRNGGVPKV